MQPELGNNAQLPRQLGLRRQSRFGENDVGWLGAPEDAAVRTVGDLARLIEQRLGRAPLVIGDAGQPLGQVGWCTGAAQGYLDDAIAAACATLREVSKRYPKASRAVINKVASEQKRLAC